MSHSHDNHEHSHSCECGACRETAAKAANDSCSCDMSHDKDHDSCHDDCGESPHPQSCSCGCCHHEEDFSSGCSCGHCHDESPAAPLSKPAAIIGCVLAVIALFTSGGTAFWLFAAATLLVGYPLFLQGIRSIFLAFSFDELGLLTIAAAASLALAATSSDPFEGAFEAFAVTALFRLGNKLEASAIAKSQRDIEALIDIRPESAVIITPDGSQKTVPASKVAVGSSILLRPGDRVPIDCEVVSGEGYADFSAITGEPIPLFAGENTKLLSGAINLDGVLTCRTTTAFEDSAASRIIKLVRQSAANKGAAEKLITRFSKIYTPAVISAAALLAFVPPLIGAGAFSVWISRALVFLVASCPCALVISVPLTFFTGVGVASRAGILIKGARYIEALARADCVAFDKTGTLTSGVPAVEAMTLAENSLPRERLLAIAAAAEKNSTHPAAKAIIAYAGSVPELQTSTHTEHSGMGVSLLCENDKVLCGSSRLIERFGIACPKLGDSTVYLAVNGVVQCGFSLADSPREQSAPAVKELGILGLKSLAVLTGDNEISAKAVAQSVGISEVYSQLMPEQKLEKLRTLRQNSRGVVFVGDGINDAPVLADADVGVAMGFGTDAAIEAADVVLMSENLLLLPKAIKISRMTVKRATQNIVFALTIKAAVLILGALGLAGMWLAVFADVGVSILAILNSLRLSRDISR